MAAMRGVGGGHQLPGRANVREEPGEYVIEFDVADFTERELTVEVTGRRVTMRGDQVETREDERRPFRPHERLEESFRLPDDADVDCTKVYYRHGTLAIHAPRVALVTRMLSIEHPTFLSDPDAVPS